MTEKPNRIVNSLDWETIWFRHQVMEEMPPRLKEWVRPYLLENLEVPVDENGIIYAGDFERKFIEENEKYRELTVIQRILRVLDGVVHI